jgi:hypothetical protein
MDAGFEQDEENEILKTKEDYKMRLCYVVLTVQQKKMKMSKRILTSKEVEEEYYGESDSQLSDSINKLIAEPKRKVSER